jgi:hypothetical protein
VTTEYDPEKQDVLVSVTTTPEGGVSFGVYLASTHEGVYEVTLTPESARETAQKLTLASWRAEELFRGES